MAEKRSFSKAVSQGKTGKQPSIVETKQSSGAQPKLPNLAQPGAAPNLRADADMASPTRTKDKDQDRDNDGLDSQAPTPTQESPGPTPQPKRHLASTGSALLPMDTSPVASSDLGMKETIRMAATETADPPSLGQALCAEYDEVVLHHQVNALQQCRTCNTSCTRAFA